MSSSIYSRLAVTNLKNNRKTYVPYILTAILTVMMYYIMDALSRNTNIGDGNLRTVLVSAVGVIIVFSVIFLFYTNSFLIKRRKKEIGVYNILGMGKRHIAKMLLIESLITAVVSIVVGIAGGIIFSKLMYLILLKILHYDVGIEFEISVSSLGYTLLLFVFIFVLTLIYNLLQIKLSNPIELLHGSSQGEKEPKTKWVLTIFGVAALGIGYYIALTTEAPLAAIPNFFVAVISVILGTYALFVAGSIAIFKGLRKNKRFYYKTKHFTSVSGMIYRMKQNAVGLANICILSTMVLVMISTTISLYAGMNDLLYTRFPQEFDAKTNIATPESEQKVHQIIEEELKKAGVKTENRLEYHQGDFAAIKKADGFALEQYANYSDMDICELYMIPLEDYNQMEGKDSVLASDEVYLYCPGGTYGKDTVKVGDKTYRVVKELESMKIEPKNHSNAIVDYYIVVPDTDQIHEFLNYVYANSGMQEEWVNQMKSLTYKETFDLKGNEEDCLRAMDTMKKRIEKEVEAAFCESRELNREGFYSLYGGLLFIGIYLGIMFLMATVLIIYYKQISEGYDDKERYQIMQKVGMSKREVKRSIRSQVLTVFFLPLVVAVVHIAVAFKVVTKLLAILNLVNVPLFLGYTIATVAVFAVFYGIVFGVTAREYYKIVN